MDVWKPLEVGEDVDELLLLPFYSHGPTEQGEEIYVVLYWIL